MEQKRYRLAARVDSDRPEALGPVRKTWCGKGGSVRPIPGGFEVTAELNGEEARELNRRLLSELRRAERRTRLRAEWTSEGVTERFFDYVPKGTRAAAAPTPGR